MGIILVHLPVPFASFCHVQALFVSMICSLVSLVGSKDELVDRVAFAVGAVSKVR
jgi:uncharacterized protein (DUF697 family)